MKNDGRPMFDTDSASFRYMGTCLSSVVKVLVVQFYFGDNCHNAPC